jgi:hypothetical protein
MESSSDPHAPLVPVCFHPAVAAAHLAFRDHRPLVLSPDIIWMLLAQGAANHINANAEDLRRQLVEHEGKVRLEVRRDDFKRGRPDNDWPGVVEELGAQVREHVGVRTHDMFLPAFSTTGPVERVAGGIVLLDAMQQYFEYQMTTMCGIPRVFLDGTVADWERVAERAQGLSRLGLDWWTDPLEPILEQFVAAADGRPDAGFWKSLYKLDHASGGPYITGWILAFFPYLGHWADAPLERNPWLAAGGTKLQRLLYPSEKDDPFGNPTTDSFPLGLSRAPFQWEYYGEPLAMELVAGFVGVRQDADTLAVRPEIGWAVHEPAVREPLLAARAEAARAEQALAEKRAFERAQQWTRRGMCPRCETWLYLFEGQRAEHCGVPLVRLEEHAR